MVKCKHCGSEDGFYVPQRYKGSNNCYFNSDGYYGGDDNYNTDMYSNATITWESAYAYCNLCGKVIGKSNELIKMR